VKYTRKCCDYICIAIWGRPTLRQSFLP